MKLLTRRQAQRLRGRELIAFRTGVAMSGSMFRQMSLWKKLKVLFNKAK